MKKGDFVIILCAVLLALLPLAALLRPAAAPANAVVRKDSQIVRTLPLHQNAETVFSDADGSNTVAVRNGEASIVSADCPDQTCVRMGGVSRTNETLVCLPHRLTVTIEGADGALDAVTQ